MERVIEEQQGNPASAIGTQQLIQRGRERDREIAKKTTHTHTPRQEVKVCITSMF